MGLRQPQSMQNYTELGFKKIKTPDKIWKLIKSFWDDNQQSIQKKENWPTGNTYTNHWKSPSRMLNVEDTGLRGGGHTLKQAIWDAAKDTLSEWVQEDLIECSLYGIRIYTQGSILSTHVDRLPLVSSAIINVHSDVNEPWPLEVVGHDGFAYNVTMEPGDMVLYESHSVLHGRPYPLNGNYVANLFVHFEPTGHSDRHNHKYDHGNVHRKYKEAVRRGHGGHENEDNEGLPPYILPGSPEVANYIQRNPNSEAARRSKISSSTTGSTAAHFHAVAGDLNGLKEEVKKNKDIIHAEDSNGWKPLHEAARGGSIDVVRYLYEQGVDINSRTGAGKGYSPLAIAKQQLGIEHPMYEFLKSLGGEAFEPEL
mmetsp:Transcript_6904/g.9889  ORF Transcript_6904/g.9889 Transcript_6904/m.9889 type:complete len:368 (+) Transcript_6904:92-1195(+)